MNQTVFIVDDDQGVRDALSMLLETSGYAVKTFPGAEAFLEFINPERQGCIILDVHMPVVDGPSLQEELQRRGIQLPVIFLSAFSNIPVTVRTIKAGAIDFLTKPVDGNQLLDRIEDAFSKNREIHEKNLSDQSLSERISKLTVREKEIMIMAAAGHSSKEIGRSLGISHRTVEVHRAHIMQKTCA
ncbi:MAG: DNA-binding response regulator, partial [Acidiphilium sp. 21-62-4]